MAKIEVVYGVWGFGATEDSEATVLDGGLHEDFEVTKENAPYLAAGEAAGAVRIVEVSDAEAKLLDGHVESQEDSEKAYEAAQADGRWHEGNLTQFVHDTEARLALPDDEANLTAGDRAFLQRGLVDAYERLGDEAKAKSIRESIEAGGEAAPASEAAGEGKEG
jgi:hypothetical protein